MVRALVVATERGTGGQFGNNGCAVAMQVINLDTRNAFEEFKTRCDRKGITVIEVDDDGASNG